MDNNPVTDLPPDSVIFGKSSSMAELEGNVRRLLGMNLPIILQGESGAGKSILSKFIHNNSTAVAGPYVKVNCASDDGTLLEALASTLVEEERTNGDTFPAQLDLSYIGTLFLDEVGELSPKRQLQLVHLLPDRQGCGDNDPSSPCAKARIVGATARNLRQEVKEKRFRRDLFYRLAVVILEVPPLRHRRDDLPVIANHLRRLYSENFGLPDRPFSDKLIERMHEYGWPGNIRELENFVCRYVILGSEDRVLGEFDSNSENPRAPVTITPGETLLREVTRRTLANVEREMIVRALELHNGSLKRAAGTLGISYRTLINKMDQAGLPRTRHASKSG